MISYMGMYFCTVNIDREYLNREQWQALRFESCQINTKIHFLHFFKASSRLAHIEQNALKRLLKCSVDLEKSTK